MVNFFSSPQYFPDVDAILLDSVLNQKGQLAMTTDTYFAQTDVQQSVIAELVFIEEPPINFARLVADLDSVLARLHAKDRQLAWDCEDVAIFDMPGTRIALAYNDSPRIGIKATLTLSVGPSHLPPPPTDGEPVSARHDALCSKLVERVQARLKPDAVFWHETEALVTVEVIDSLSTPLPLAKPRRTSGHPIHTPPDINGVYENYDSALHRTHVRPQRPAPRGRDRELCRLRNALYPVSDQPVAKRNSTQMRLAAHTMNATLIVVSMPIGVALVGYSLVKGDNMRLTANMLVLTGCVTALLQTDWAQQMAAFSGV